MKETKAFPLLALVEGGGGGGEREFFLLTSSCSIEA